MTLKQCPNAIPCDRYGQPWRLPEHCLSNSDRSYPHPLGMPPVRRPPAIRSERHDSWAYNRRREAWCPAPVTFAWQVACGRHSERDARRPPSSVHLHHFVSDTGCLLPYCHRAGRDTAPGSLVSPYPCPAQRGGAFWAPAGRWRAANCWSCFRFRAQPTRRLARPTHHSRQRSVAFPASSRGHRDRHQRSGPLLTSAATAILRRAAAFAVC